MQSIKEFLKKYGIYILIASCLILGLSFLYFKNATLDDDLYLFETSIMTEALKRGEWIGNYAVGTHGFLFKLPVALAFLLTGSSLAVATIWNILLACLSIYLFYIFLKKYFSQTYALLGTLLLFANFQFILNLPTYMREVPVFLAVIVFLNLIAYKKPYWTVGLSLLLMFDAKEYVMYMILPAYLLYIFFQEWKGFNVKTLWVYIKSYTQVLLPTIVFITLMITTPIIPINAYALSVIPGVTEGGVAYNLKHFDTGIATINRIDLDASEIPMLFNNDTVVGKVLNTGMEYFGKLIYPRSFSFLSVPKIIFFPALLTSIMMFKNAIKKKDSLFISLALILWSFISIFILRASFDRYLFPILPVIFFFFVIFIKDIVKEKRKFVTILVTTLLLTIAGLFFEVDYLWIKIALNVAVVAMYLLYYFYNAKFKHLYIWIVSILSVITFSVIAFFYYANGQIHQYLLWGNDYEVKKVVKLFDNDEKILMNDPGWDILVKVYRGDNRYDPEWKWKLSKWVPRQSELKMFEKLDSFVISGKTIEADRTRILKSGIDKVVLAVSTVEGNPFIHQDRLEKYLKADWLSLSDTVELKNKIIYIFEVVK
ncbi:glycosyltransferase family 39 protein [Patescibacteria group bacterium]|nr:glycosyltransferase family 39 protein [Patescibacteria group bacterium]